MAKGEKRFLLDRPRITLGARDTFKVRRLQRQVFNFSGDQNIWNASTQSSSSFNVRGSVGLLRTTFLSG